MIERKQVTGSPLLGESMDAMFAPLLAFLGDSTEPIARKRSMVVVLTAFKDVTREFVSLAIETWRGVEIAWV